MLMNLENVTIGCLDYNCLVYVLYFNMYIS